MRNAKETKPQRTTMVTTRDQEEKKLEEEQKGANLLAGTKNGNLSPSVGLFTTKKKKKVL